MDHYKVLGIDKKASKSDIKEAFRRLALKYHPDKHSDSTKSARDNATLRFKQASEAYEVLIDERKRADYNQSLNRRRSTTTGAAYGYYHHHRHHSYSYNRTPSPSRWGFDLRFMTTRAFLLNLAFAGVLLGGAVFIDSTGQTLWNMQNSGTVELLVHMDCDGCQRRIRKAISKLDGVDTLDIDMDCQKVTVTGYVDQRKVLKAVRRTGRKAEFWPSPYDGVYHPFAAQYLEDSTHTSSYNYYQHGYNESVRGYFPDPAFSIIIDDHTANLFNDDNVHACNIM